LIKALKTNKKIDFLAKAKWYLLLFNGKLHYILAMEREGQFVGESGAFLDAVEKASRAAPLRSSSSVNAEPARN
jgi:hypothetical protein